MLKLIIVLFYFLFLLQAGVFAQSVQNQKKASEIKGQVVSFFGQSWEGASLELKSIELTSQDRKIEQITKTTSQGEYSFSNLPEGSYEVTVFGGFGTLRETKKTSVIRLGETYNMNFGIEVGLTFCKTKQIYGSIKNTNNKPIENATITLINAFKESFIRISKSDKNGLYILEICATGQYVIYASAPNYKVHVNTFITPYDSSESISQEINFKLLGLSPRKIQ